MARRFVGALAALILLVVAVPSAAQRSYAGFDKNDYPGDVALAALRKSFNFAGYWLNTPPGAQQNSWMGKRVLLKQNGFGFLVLFNGRLDAELKGKDAAALGMADGQAAVAAAAREGFSTKVRIFLDQEEGGRLLPEQAAYLFAWVDAVRGGGARAGVYCSGIDVPEGGGTISTARDIVEREDALAKNTSNGRVAERLALWIADDRCPPSPGCTLKSLPLSTVQSRELVGSAEVWQYVQSPRRKAFSAGCPANTAPDGMCYAPGLTPGANTFVDLNVAGSADPSEARR
jgi:hypothetical protein